MIKNTDEETIIITPAMSESLRLLWKRKGVSVAGFVDYCGALPAGLTEGMITEWLALRVRHAVSSHWDFVIERWQMIPSAKAGYSHIKSGVRGGRPKGVSGTHRVSVTPDMHQKFMSEIARTGADIDLDLVEARGAPMGLKHRTILVLKRQESKTIRDDYWAFIMKTLGAMPDYR